MSTSAGEHTNQAARGRHAAACEHPGLPEKQRALGQAADCARAGRAARVLADTSRGERGSAPAGGWRSRRGLAGAHGRGKRGEGPCGAELRGEMQGGFFLAVLTTWFGSAKS